MTDLIYQHDAYTKSCDATVINHTTDGIELNQTVFYPMGGGQPGDTGMLSKAGDPPCSIEIIDTRKSGEHNRVLHIPSQDAPQLPVGSKVIAEINWPRRHRLMRVHSCLHLLSAVLPFPVTGGQVSDGKGRLDFDIPDSILDKSHITDKLNALIESGHPITSEFIDEAELAAKPELIKTMAVKPPRGAGHIRLVRIKNLDLQPCGGTHVRSTDEISEVLITKIKKKGRQNRRVSLQLLGVQSEQATNSCRY